MRGILIILLFTSSILADTEYGSFIHGGITRTYITYLPENIQGNSPLVINLHGYGQLADTFMNNTFMRAVADTAGFIVCYPRAIDEKWNSGLGDIPGYPCPNVDDVGFISALIDTLLSNYSIDQNRLYVCGLSNGGFMTFRVLCELNDRFSKAASVSGAMTSTTVAGCGSAFPKPMLLMHGTSDPVVPYYGGVAGVTSAEETLQYWLDFNGCSQAADTIALPDIDPTDGCNTEVMIYEGSSGNQSVVFYKMHNAGHYWPGVDHNWASQGPANTDFLADVEIWRFFNSDSFEVPVGIAEGLNQIPPGYYLHQNYPNPFNPTTTIQYSLPEAGLVNLKIVDIRGKEVMTLLKANMEQGNYEVQWNGMDDSGNPVSTGVYFCRLQSGDYTRTIKMIYLK